MLSKPDTSSSPVKMIKSHEKKCQNCFRSMVKCCRNVNFEEIDTEPSTKKMMNFDYSQKFWNISEISRYYSGRIARPWYPEGSIPAPWKFPPPFMAFARYLFSLSSPIKIATMIKHHILLLSLVPRQNSLPGYSLAPKAKLSSHVSIDTPTNAIWIVPFPRAWSINRQISQIPKIKASKYAGRN